MQQPNIAAALMADGASSIDSISETEDTEWAPLFGDSASWIRCSAPTADVLDSLALRPQSVRPERVCFPRAAGARPEANGQIIPGTGFGFCCYYAGTAVALYQHRRQHVC